LMVPASRTTAPLGVDGYSVNLHHPGGEPGPLRDQLLTTKHTGVGYYKELHPYVGQRKSWLKSSDRNSEWHWEQWDRGVHKEVPWWHQD
jgi:hypothetical protein